MLLSCIGASRFGSRRRLAVEQLEIAVRAFNVASRRSLRRSVSWFSHGLFPLASLTRRACEFIGRSSSIHLRHLCCHAFSSGAFVPSAV
jgi:hypothetical protein